MGLEASLFAAPAAIASCELACVSVFEQHLPSPSGIGRHRRPPLPPHPPPPLAAHLRVRRLHACLPWLSLLQEAFEEAEADLLRGGGSGKRDGKRQKRGSGAGATPDEQLQGDEEDTFFSGLALQGKLPKYVELLKFKASRDVAAFSAQLRASDSC